MENADVADVLAEVWGLVPLDIRHFHGELDQTYRVVTEHRVVAVKVRGTETQGSLDLELAVLHRLAEAGVPTPRIVPTSDGHDRARVGGADIWMLEWLDGSLWADVPYRSTALLRDLGRVSARVALALSSLDHPGARRSHHWDVSSADESLRLHIDQASGTRRAIVDRALESFAERVQPRVSSLPWGLVHQDLNDHNLLVGGRPGEQGITGVLDPGDALESVVVSELAVAVAYAMLRTDVPLDAARDVVTGWCEVSPLSADEIECVFPMAVARLCVNATTWAARRAEGQVDYANARSQHTWATLEKLDRIHPDVAATVLRQAAGHDAAERIVAAARAALLPPSVAVLPLLETVSIVGVDLDPHRDLFDVLDALDGPAIAEAVAAAHETPCYRPHAAVRLDLGGSADGQGGPATTQLGVELLLGGSTAIASPVRGRVVSSSDDEIVLAHDTPAPFWSHWNGVVSDVRTGDDLDAGSTLGVGDRVSVRLSTVEFASDHDFPTAVRPADAVTWTALSPDPATFLGLVERPKEDWRGASEVTALREQRLAHSQRSYYRTPMNLVRARGTTFIDDQGHHYLDAINNVSHVGHGHPHVVEAAVRQMRRLNTNSRFVYEEMATFADRLASLLPDPLEVVFLVCSGSEANDLALRISRQVTGRDDVMVIDGAYHGNTTAVTGISPNRYKGPGGGAPPATTHEVQQPNVYRGPHSDANSGSLYADDVRDVVGRLVSDDRPPAAFIAESLMGTAGQVIHPPGYLEQSFAHVRSAGGLCISDEVQVGFGRLGERFWGFELGGVVPDIVTMGKPMGNGHPIAALVTTREIADAFDTGMKYFNTFGGNPVSCAVAGAVLDVIEDEGLQQCALDIGGQFLAALTGLMDRHSIIGDVRGEGLYLGVEFVHDRDTLEPAATFTMEVCERMRERGVIVYPNGDLGNVLKIKPPMVFSTDDVDRFVSQLDATLLELVW